VTISSKEIIQQLRLKMPIVLELPDAFSGETTLINRDNILALAVIDAGDLVLESQTVAALYGEMVRLHAAATKVFEDKEAQMRQWKASMRAACRSSKTKPSQREQEDYYQLDAEYLPKYEDVNKAKAIAQCFEDLKEVFRMKARQLDKLHTVDFGHTRGESSFDRLSEMAEQKLRDETDKIQAESGSAAAAEAYKKKSGKAHRA
jgi:hypothetical protein